jgi:hypothetical protein
MSIPIWSIWRKLPALGQIYAVLLSIVSIYTVYTAVTVLLRLRSLAKQEQTAEITFLRCSAERLHARCANVRQVLGGTFYLFGLSFFLVLPQAITRIPDDSRTLVGTLILNNLLMYSAFAVNVFAVLTGLHLLQWFVAAQVRSFIHHLTCGAAK